MQLSLIKGPFLVLLFVNDKMRHYSTDSEKDSDNKPHLR